MLQNVNGGGGKTCIYLITPQLGASKSIKCKNN